MGERVFVLPDLGEGLEEATVTQWLVAEGDRVELNQPIAEFETAKAVVEMPSPYAGVIAKLHAMAGSTIAVGSPLVTFEVAGPAGVETPPAAATPAVRRLARDLGVDLSQVSGTGPDGRIAREDVERAPGGRAGRTSEGVPVSPIRRAIAENLSRQAAIPQVTTFRQVDCTALDAFRRELGVSPLPVFVRALAEVCREHPMLNASWDGERILRFRGVHVGIATDTDAGLLVPVVRDAGSIGIGAVAAEIERLAAGRARGIAAAGRRGGGDGRGQQHRQLRLRVRHAAAEPRPRGHDRARRDRAAGAGRGRPRRGQARMHALAHVRPSGARRGGGRPRAGGAGRRARVAAAAPGAPAVTCRA